MASRRSKTKAPTELKRHPLQRFEAVERKRSELQNAPYNPRLLTEKGRKKLKAGLKSLGLLDPLVWNVRSGALVGGHQRLKILDRLADGAKDYLLTVAQVDLSDTEEREANLLLNNVDAQGENDLAKFQKLLKDTPQLRPEATAYDQGDLYKLFGGNPFGEANKTALADLATKFRDYNEVYEQRIRRGSNAAKRDEHFYLVVVFADDDDRRRFTDSLGLDRDRYIDGRLLWSLLHGGDDDAISEGLVASLAQFAAEAYMVDDPEFADARETLDKAHPDWPSFVSDEMREDVLRVRQERLDEAEKVTGDAPQGAQDQPGAAS